MRWNIYRDLPDKDDLGTSDPYAEIFYSENNGKEEIRLGQTSTLTDTENPDFGGLKRLFLSFDKNIRVDNVCNWF